MAYYDSRPDSYTRRSYNKPDINVRYFEAGELGRGSKSGYYWAIGMPGYENDTPWYGVFNSEQAAVNNARKSTPRR